jgi:hypothetical protein
MRKTGPSLQTPYPAGTAGSILMRIYSKKLPTAVRAFSGDRLLASQLPYPGRVRQDDL